MESNKIECPHCLGEGRWETECCNGSGGCSCRGERVDMGMCNVCRGTGKIDPNNYDSKANLRTIQGYCFTGSGPSTGYWSTAPALGKK